MSLVNFSGNGPLMHDRMAQTNAAPAFSASVVMDASNERVAIIGSIWHPTVKSGTINIRKVHFMVGALTFNAASTIRCSLQNISATAGPPFQPDGTQDQTYDFALGTGLTANAWNSTGNLSADRVVDLSGTSLGSANSRQIAVVFEYTTFTAADSFVLRQLDASAANNDIFQEIGACSLLYTGSWASVVGLAPIVAFECDDGTFAFMESCYPVSAVGSTSVGNASTDRAAGLKFRFPMEVKIDMIGLMLTVQNGADGRIVLYDSDGTTVLASVDIDNDAVIATNTRVAVARIVPVTLAANTYYRLAFEATTATTTTIRTVSANAAALMDGFSGGQNFHYTTRDSGGTWTDTTTRLPVYALRLSAVHDGSGGGGLAMPVSGRICA